MGTYVNTVIFSVLTTCRLHICSDLQLFVVDLDNTNDFSATHLATVKFEYPVTTFALQDQHLAVVGYTGSRSYYLQSLKISYLSPVTVSNRAMVYIETQVCIIFLASFDIHVQLGSIGCMLICHIGRHAFLARWSNRCGSL